MKKTLSVPELHQRRVAIKTLQLSEVGARIMGGMDHIQAVKVLRGFGHSDRDIRTRLETASYDAQSIIKFMA